MSVLGPYRDHPIEIREPNVRPLAMTIGEALDKGLFDPLTTIMLETMAESGQLDGGKLPILERIGGKTKFSLDGGTETPPPASH